MIGRPLKEAVPAYLFGKSSVRGRDGRTQPLSHSLEFFNKIIVLSSMAARLWASLAPKALRREERAAGLMKCSDFINAVTAVGARGVMQMPAVRFPTEEAPPRQRMHPNNLGSDGLGTTFPDDETSWDCYDPGAHEEPPGQPSERLAPGLHHDGCGCRSSAARAKPSASMKAI